MKKCIPTSFKGLFVFALTLALASGQLFLLGNLVKAATGPAAITAPTIEIANIDGTSITFSWNAVSGANSYKITIGKYYVGGSEIEPIGTTYTKYTFSNLEPNTGYSARVKACNSLGVCSEYSNYSGAAQTDAIKVVSPTDLEVDEYDSDSIKWVWSAPYGAVKYRIYLNEYYVGGSEISKEIITTYHEFTGLKADTTYDAKIQACDRSGYCAPVSSVVRQKTSAETVATPTTLSVPANLKIDTVTSDSITWKWDRVTGATSYVIYKSRLFYGGFEEEKTVTGESATFSGLQPSTDYQAKVKACNNSGCSAYTSYLVQTTKVSVLLSLKTDGIINGIATWRWDTPPAGTLINFKWAEYYKGGSGKTINSIPATNYSLDVSANSNVWYEGWIQSCVNGVCSAWSEGVIAKPSTTPVTPTTPTTPAIPTTPTTPITCPVNYFWFFGDWSTCANSVQTRTVVCKDSSNNTVADSLCSGTKSATSQSCISANTTYSWAVKCQDNNGSVVADNLCSGTKPDIGSQPQTQAPTVVAVDYKLDTDGEGLTDFQEGLYGTDINKEDTEGDGFDDLTEIKSGYSPLSPEAKKISTNKNKIYGLSRLGDLITEENAAIILRDELKALNGGKILTLKTTSWGAVVNAFIYGGYTPQEIFDLVKGNKTAVHPTIPAVQWRQQNNQIVVENE